jgi:P-type E1-E2 ATPase
VWFELHDEATNIRSTGTVVFGDQIRTDAGGLISMLQTELGMRTMILSGDSGPGLSHVARSLGIADARTCLPHEKAAVVRSLQQAGQTVVMVGDGVSGLLLHF